MVTLYGCGERNGSGITNEGESIPIVYRSLYIYLWIVSAHRMVPVNEDYQDFRGLSGGGRLRLVVCPLILERESFESVCMCAIVT